MKNIRTSFFTVTVSSLLSISCQLTKNKETQTENSKKNIENPIAMADQWRFIGEAVNEPDYDIWGSSPIRDEQGTIHLFCARWPSDTPFKTAWRYKSEIAHYTAQKPEGPFVFKEVVGKGKNNQKWNAAGYHNPNIRKIDNQYVLVYIANDGAKNHGPNQRIGMLVSDKLNGAWTEIPNKNIPLLSPPDNDAIWCFGSGVGVNNPSILKHPNGKYYLYFKAMAGTKGKVSMGVAISNRLQGPYQIQPKPITNNKVAIEDGYAFLWKNKICLMTTDNHGILEEGGGLLWVSNDGIKFEPEPLSGFHNFQNYYLKGNVPDVANARYGKKVKFERPQLLMDANNEPEYLYCPSGVALDGSNGTNSYVLKYIKDK